MILFPTAEQLIHLPGGDFVHGGCVIEEHGRSLKTEALLQPQGELDGLLSTLNTA